MRSLRALLPSWRFFDRATVPPRLFVRVGGGAWTAVEPPPRRWYRWAFSPAGNLALAEHALVEQLISEIDEIDAAIPDHDPRITTLPAYALVTRVAREHVPAGQPFAWKIQLSDDESLESVAL